MKSAISVTKEGVFKLLLKLKPNRATGPDLLPARILKDMAKEIALILTTIFQRSFDTGIVPSDWRTTNITAIFKNGEKYKPANYRPVSLISLFCKIQEHIVTTNVLNHLKEHHILTDCQHGFRARSGCETQLHTLAQELIAGLDKRHQRDMIIPDFSKAFGRVPHERLMVRHKRSNPNMDPGFLTDRTQHTVVIPLRLFWSRHLLRC